METPSSLARFQSIKEGALEAYRGLAMLASEVGLRSLEQEILSSRVPKLTEERFHLVVLGEFNHGKSTFVNALLGREILPAGITPTTATINHIDWGARPAARVVLRGGAVEEIPIERLADWVTCGAARLAEVEHVEVEYPAELLAQRTTLVDTPGVNDLNEQRAEITYSYVPRADAVVFLLDASQLLKQSERLFLEEKILTRTKERLLFVVGKIDQLDEEERATALAYAKAQLCRIVPEPAVFPLSSRWELAGRRAESGFGPLLERLGHVIAADRGRVILDNALGDARRAAVYLRQNLGIKRHGLGLELSELEERVERVRARLDGSRRTIQEHRDRIKAEASAVRALAQHDIDDFIGRFCDALPAAIASASGDDIKRYLPSFIADRFKAWAEREGEKLGGLLEELAEEIIQITNEDVREALEGVAQELGARETRIDLTVDTLKYDVGVFALGTLGTALFLFVNTFVGGLLFAATPLLAVVLKGVVEREIKAQATEHAPAAVRRAGEAIAPRLVQAIAEYAARLDEFVVQAGDALHRGISELLDRALLERRSVGANAERARADLETQLQHVASLEARIEALRATLWSDSQPDAASQPSS